MSSVGSSTDTSSASGNNDAIRKTREDASKAESDLVKKHQKEIRRLNEEHYAEVEKLKKNFNDQIDDLKQNAHQSVNERDHKYQQEIEGMRGLYKKQLQDQADENQRQSEAVKKSTSSDNGNERKQAEKRIENLNKSYDQSLGEREKSFTQSLDESRAAQKAAVADNHQRLSKKYDSDSQALMNERDQRVGELQKNLDDTHRTYAQQMRDQEIQRLQNQQRASQALVTAVRREQETGADQQENLRAGFKDGLNKTRERFEAAAVEHRTENEAGLQDIKATVGDRVQNQVVRLQQQKEDLKAEQVRQEQKNKQAQKREMADMADAYQKNMDNYREQRDSAVRDGTVRAHKQVEQIHKELDGQATETNRFYRSEEDEQNRIHRNAYDNLKGNFEVRQEQTKSQADQRVKNLYESTADEKSRMADLQVETHTASQRSHQDEMKALRSKLEDDKRVVVNSLQDQIQKQEMQHSERMAQVVGKYEKQVQTLKDQLEHEKKTNDVNMRRSVEEMQRDHQVSIDQLESQNRDRLRILETRHDQELKALNKRNEEKIDQVIAQTKRA